MGLYKCPTPQCSMFLLLGVAQASRQAQALRSLADVEWSFAISDEHTGDPKALQEASLWCQEESHKIMESIHI